MTVRELHEITSELVAKNKCDIEVAIDYFSFSESENGSILLIESAAVQRVQGADDSGPVGRKYPMFVISGDRVLHRHGDPIG